MPTAGAGIKLDRTRGVEDGLRRGALARGAPFLGVGDQLLEPGGAGRVLGQFGDRLGGTAAGGDPRRVGAGQGRQQHRGIAESDELRTGLLGGVRDLLAGGERNGSGEAGREDEAVDDAALLQQQCGEGAAGGEKLRELADDGVGEMQAEQPQHGADAGV
jgi:hypothetical protein